METMELIPDCYNNNLKFIYIKLIDVLEVVLNLLNA